MNTNFRMVVAGGGTGGHFFPAQVIRNALINRGTFFIPFPQCC